MMQMIHLAKHALGSPLRHLAVFHERLLPQDHNSPIYCREEPFLTPLIPHLVLVCRSRSFRQTTAN